MDRLAECWLNHCRTSTRWGYGSKSCSLRVTNRHWIMSTRLAPSSVHASGQLLRLVGTGRRPRIRWFVPTGTSGPQDAPAASAPTPPYTEALLRAGCLAADSRAGAVPCARRSTHPPPARRAPADEPASPEVRASFCVWPSHGRGGRQSAPAPRPSPPARSAWRPQSAVGSGLKLRVRDAPALSGVPWKSPRNASTCLCAELGA